ncbi:putative ABC transporter [Neospora caninum Liverpool]|uniref:ABC transporter, putative n=1 Tax=Neospora caninum (strain Liverpool) TaxID=572307 RepID=F0VEF2_NEOCL|nr:putative ABC transporter [Neospora caninum Liverpool]CBZ52096.1 putative ABC transporter [Neospora caninum Liverpool]CEL66058.1 TPA: ABC transporter, putative [Neospora caninum Liverpool]|eukprot:XP_003882128.1 putative ABC transporter [Neospora caninum Liverpool]
MENPEASAGASQPPADDARLPERDAVSIAAHEKTSQKRSPSRLRPAVETKSETRSLPPGEDHAPETRRWAGAFSRLRCWLWKGEKAPEEQGKASEMKELGPLLPASDDSREREDCPRSPNRGFLWRDRHNSADMGGEESRGVAFSFRDIQCSVRLAGPDGKKQKKTILWPISGDFPRGSVVGILGPSGSGKTTLLDVLANKKIPRAYTGEVFVDGKKRDDKSFKALSIYAPQDNIFNGNEEVWEVLAFAAALKSGRSKEDQKKLVDATLSFLGLERVARQRVGNTVVRGVSGGQKRRLVIGRALVTNASLAFCDEPTSGLSSTDAEALMLGIREVAKTCCVSFLVVIHQPRVEVFELFDEILLLAQGRCLYNGPRSQMEAYFSALGFPLPPYVNPAEFYMELTAENATVERLATAYAAQAERASRGETGVSSRPGAAVSGALLGGIPARESEESRHTGEEERQRKADRDEADAGQTAGERSFLVKEEERDDDATQDRRKSIAASLAGTQALVTALHEVPGTRRPLPGFYGQFLILTHRSLTLAWRDRNVVYMVACSALLAATLTAILFFNVYREKAIMYHLSALFLVSLSLASIPSVNMAMYLEKKVSYLYESSDGFYAAGPYLLSEMTTGFLMLLGATLLALVVVFPCCAFPFSKFGMIFLLFILFLLVVDAVMQFAAAVCPTFIMASTFAGGWLALTSVVNGYNANPKSIPGWLTWLVYLSPFYYLVDGVAVVLYWENHDVFGTPEKAAKFGYTSCEELLKAYGFAGMLGGSSLTPPQWLWCVDVLVLFLMTVGMKAIACFYQAYFVRLRR